MSQEVFLEPKDEIEEKHEQNVGWISPFMFSFISKSFFCFLTPSKKMGLYPLPSLTWNVGMSLHCDCWESRRRIY